MHCDWYQFATACVCGVCAMMHVGLYMAMAENDGCDNPCYWWCLPILFVPPQLLTLCDSGFIVVRVAHLCWVVL